MPALRSILSLLLPVALLGAAVVRGAAPSERPKAATPVLTGPQIVQILDETVQWYRTLGVQQQNASEPSDQLIVFANRQAADKIVASAFQIARANAELLSSEASASADTGSVSLPQALQQRQAELKARLESLDREIAAAHRAPSSGRLAELQSERAMVAARENLLENMTDFENRNDPHTAGAEALKAEIDAIAASIPSESASAATPAAAHPLSGTAAATAASVASPASANRTATTAAHEGIWALATNVMSARRKVQTIDSIDRQTAALSVTFEQLASPALTQLKQLAAEGDALSEQADHASPAELPALRARFDTLAWLIQQSTAIVAPLSQAQILLAEYRHNLESWRASTQRRTEDAWRALALRVGILAAMLAGLYVLGEIWRRAVLHFARDIQHRYQLLIVRRIVLWALALSLIGLSVVSQLSSFATFAGLLTAGVAVALQSVLMSVVGYFFLIGKYGIKVGDRIQIGTVIGDVVDIGLVRMHLLELNPSGALGPTGRLVGFPNLIVFQGTAGLFRQIPGVSLAWHEISLTLPEVRDYAALKARMLAAVHQVIDDYWAKIEGQLKALPSALRAGTKQDWQPHVQMQLVEGRMQALVRYPATQPDAAEIGERISSGLLQILATAQSTSAESPKDAPIA